MASILRNRGSCFSESVRSKVVVLAMEYRGYGRSENGGAGSHGIDVLDGACGFLHISSGYVFQGDENTAAFCEQSTEESLAAVQVVHNMSD